MLKSVINSINHNQMKKSIFLAAMLVLIVGTSACKKNKCAECHYEQGATQVDIGEYCGDDLKNIEASGYIVDSILYEVHCGEH
jgi:hypothetical protein